MSLWHVLGCPLIPTQTHAHTSKLGSLNDVLLGVVIRTYKQTKTGDERACSCEAVLTQLCPSGILDGGINKFAHVCQTTIRSSQCCHQMRQNQLFSSFQTREIPNVPSVFCGGWLINRFGLLISAERMLYQLCYNSHQWLHSFRRSCVTTSPIYIYRPPPRRFCFHPRPFVGWWVSYTKTT